MSSKILLGGACGGLLIARSALYVGLLKQTRWSILFSPLLLSVLLEPAVHGMGAPTGTLEERERSSDLEILAQCPDLGRRVASGEAPGDTPRGRFPKMSVQN